VANHLFGSILTVATGRELPMSSSSGWGEGIYSFEMTGTNSFFKNPKKTISFWCLNALSG
jgi:hypothetical protein